MCKDTSEASLIWLKGSRHIIWMIDSSNERLFYIVPRLIYNIDKATI